MINMYTGCTRILISVTFLLILMKLSIGSFSIYNSNFCTKLEMKINQFSKTENI
jgi:hypothetical protein